MNSPFCGHCYHADFLPATNVEGCLASVCQYTLFWFHSLPEVEDFSSHNFQSTLHSPNSIILFPDPLSQSDYGVSGCVSPLSVEVELSPSAQATLLTAWCFAGANPAEFRTFSSGESHDETNNESRNTYRFSSLSWLKRGPALLL